MEIYGMFFLGKPLRLKLLENKRVHAFGNLSQLPYVGIFMFMFFVAVGFLATNHIM